MKRNLILQKCGPVMVFDAVYEKGEVEFSRQYMWIDMWMIRCCFFSCVHFFVPRNTAVVMRPT